MQVALVINIGFGIANTSGNGAVGVTPGIPGGGATVLGSATGATGDALGVGTQATTRILQAAVVQTRTGDDANSVENALVINLGDGTANSGLNRIIGVLSQNGADYGLGGATGTASVDVGRRVGGRHVREHRDQAERECGRERRRASSSSPRTPWSSTSAPR